MAFSDYYLLRVGGRMRQGAAALASIAALLLTFAPAHAASTPAREPAVARATSKTNNRPVVPPPKSRKTPSLRSPSVASSTVNTNPNWQWQNPSPNGNSLFAIACPSSSVCFAAGQDGPILATTDGGATWSQQANVFGVFGLSCDSALACVGVGFQGVAIATTNGGATWSTQTINSGVSLQSVSCGGQGTPCVAVGDGGTAAITSDGGATWTPSFTGTQSDLFGVSCNGIACTAVGAGGTIISNTVMGVWSAEFSGTNATLGAVQCVELLCFAAGADGTVVQQQSANGAWTPSSTGFNVFLTGVTCSGPSSCLATGDDGNVWTQTAGIWGPVSTPESGSLNAISCPTSSTCFVAGDYGLIASTTNAGMGWYRQAVDTPFGLHGISCVTSAVCFASGDNGEVLRTEDAGTTWTAANPTIMGAGNPAIGVAVLGISCPTTSTCFAIDSIGIHTSVNQGLTWTTSSPNLGNESLGAISCASTTFCVAVGSHGLVVTSTDGTTWNPGSAATAFDLTSITCPSSTFCMAAGAGSGSGSVMLSTDGAKTWSTVLTPTQTPFGAIPRAVSCSSSTFCGIVGDTALTGFTTNGGSTWTLNGGGYQPPVPNLGSVSCISNECWGAGGTVIVFSAGGRSDQNPNPNSPFLFGDISCTPGSPPGAASCFLLFGNAVERTIDSGSHWASVEGLGVGGTIHAVSCPSTTTCFAAADGAIVTTSDASDWREQLAGVGFAFDQIACPTSSLCYAAGHQAASPTTEDVFKTSDAGLTWSSIATSFSYPSAALSCPDATDCFLAFPFGQVLKTSDGGATWPSVSGITNGASGISCPTVTTCFASVPMTPGEIMTTVDGAKSWKLGFNLATDPQAGSTGAFTSISCASATVCSAGGMSDLIATTTDGVNWRTDNLAVLANVSGVSCASTAVCFATTLSATMLTSSNFGGDWQGQIVSAVPTPGPVHFDGISCPSTTTCFAVGAAGLIATTTSGGVAWTRRHPTGAFVDDAHKIACPDPNDCYATVFTPGLDPGGVEVSHDGGATWSLHALNGADSVQSIACPSATTCFAVGWPGAIYVTTDSGATWTYQPTNFSHTDESLAGITCQSVSSCVLVGTAGLVMSTSDGGALWVPAPPQGSKNLFSVSCPTASTCVAVGDMVETLANGSWTADPSPGALSAVNCPDAATCYAATVAEGAILVSHNLGSTWAAEPSADAGGHRHIGAITCLTPTACIAAANDGVVLYTTDGATWTPAIAPTLNSFFGVAFTTGTLLVVGPGGTVLKDSGFFLNCFGLSVSFDKTSPQVAGAAVHVTASSTGCVNPLYEFWLLAPAATSYKLVQSYSTSPTYNWATTAIPVGTYRFDVWVRDANSSGLGSNASGAWDQYNASATFVLTPGCSTVGDSASPAAAAMVSTAVTVTASGSCVNANPFYEFWLLAPGAGSYTLAQPYSTSSTFNWSTTGLATGTYRISVWVHDAAGPGAFSNASGSYDAFNASLTYTLTKGCPIVADVASPAGAAMPGVPVTVTASAPGCPNPQYEFWILYPGASLYTKALPFGSSPSLSWSTTGLPLGTYRINVWVKDASSTGVISTPSGTLDAYNASLTYSLTAGCPAVGVSAAPPSPSAHGTTITFTASAPGCPSPNYEFWILSPGATSYTLVQPYSTTSSFTWSSGGNGAGSYRINVWVKNGTGPGLYSNPSGSYDAYNAGTSYQLT